MFFRVFFFSEFTKHFSVYHKPPKLQFRKIIFVAPRKTVVNLLNITFRSYSRIPSQPLFFTTLQIKILGNLATPLVTPPPLYNPVTNDPNVSFKIITGLWVNDVTHPLNPEPLDRPTDRRVVKTVRQW